MDASLSYLRQNFYIYVEGNHPIGPVDADRIARGIVAGKVPRDAHVARVGESAWNDLLDMPEIVLALKAL